jgi:hypothetical protein
MAQNRLLRVRDRPLRRRESSNYSKRKAREKSPAMPRRVSITTRTPKRGMLESTRRSTHPKSTRPKPTRKRLFFVRPRTKHHLQPPREGGTRQNLRFEAEIRLEDEVTGEERGLGNPIKAKASLENHEYGAIRRAPSNGVNYSTPLEVTMIIAMMAFQTLVALCVAYVAYCGLTEVSAMDPVLQEPAQDKSFAEMLLSMLASLFGA